MPGPQKQFDPDVALEAAMKVFWARGYEATAMSELMSAMKISKQSLYDTFGNKRSLFLKAMKHYERFMDEEILQVLEAEGSPLENLRRLITKWRKEAGRRDSVGCMLGTNIADFGCEDKEVAKVLRQLLKRIEDAFLKNLKAAQAADELDDSANPKDLARLLVTLSQGTALVGRVLDSPTIPKSVENCLMALISKK